MTLHGWARTLAALAMAALLVTVGCGTPPTGTGGNQSGTSSTQPPADAGKGQSGTGQQPPRTEITTDTANGSTIRLHVGDQLLLRLTPGLPEATWQIELSEPKVLTPLTSAALPAGAQGLYRAAAPGKTTLTVSSHYLCEDTNPPCARPDRVLSFTVVVDAP